MNTFFATNEHDWEDLGGGIKRKIVGHTDDLMAVHVCFDKGAEGKPHAHSEYDQIGYVVSGSFEAVVDGKKKVLNVGDAFIAKGGAEHGALALEENSVLLDLFSPARADFLDK